MAIIRREQNKDVDSVRVIQADAFAGDAATEPVEVSLLDKLRACDGWIPELSLVAEHEGVVVGHNVCTRGYVGDVPCLGLGPIGIQPDLQKSGFGSALMHAMIGAADALGEPVIALLGSPDYYRRFGFVASSSIGIDPPEAMWGEFFQALPLSSWTADLSGKFRYAAPFEELD